MASVLFGHAGDMSSSTPSEELTIRPAVVADVGAIQAIELDAGQLFLAVGMPTIAYADPPPPDTILHHIADGTVWVAVDDTDQPVGYAAASSVDGEGHLDQVSVSPQVAGRRVGRRLMDRVCEWSRAQGFEAVTLTTFVDVPFNGPLYERYGFVAIASETLGPELAAIRQAEIDAGIDVGPRTAMRLTLE